MSEPHLRAHPLETREALVRATLVGVVRERSAARAEAIARGLLEGGLRALEITAGTPGCFDLVAKLVAETRGTPLPVGVGTVRSLAELEQAWRAGAHFVVSPHLDPALLTASRAQGLVNIPGALTPTEILTAHAAGADFVKVFPVSAMGGARYVRLVRGPLPDVPLWVSGDVALTDIEDFLAAGVTLIGLTSALTADLPEAPQKEARARAGAALEALARVRDGQPLLTLKAQGRTMEVGLKELRRLPGTEHAPLESLVTGRRGHAVLLRVLLRSAGVPAEAQVQLTSADGETRTMAAQSLYDGGLVHFATDGHPLGRGEGGPLRLYVVGGADACANLKALVGIEVV